MSDLIDRQAAISAICNACGKIDCDKMDKCEKLQLPPANCSEFPNNSDTISRQAAIEALDGEIEITGRTNAEAVKGYVRLVRDRFERLPSAQPEIIRCTECKHYREYDSKYVENAVVVQCMADRYPISETIPDGWFCAGAERRTDEID